MRWLLKAEQNNREYKVRETWLLYSSLQKNTTKKQEICYKFEDNIFTSYLFTYLFQFAQYCIVENSKTNRETEICRDKEQKCRRMLNSS